MKSLLYNGALTLGIILATSCSQTEEKKKATDETSTQTNQTIDTSGYFIKGLLNGSPKDVAKVLGEPDVKIKASKDCDYLPSCNETTYQNKKYEVLYYNNKLKWIEINNIDIFNKNAIQYVGFPASEPTFANKFMIHWRSAATIGTATGPLIPVKGIRQISALPVDENTLLPAGNNNKGYMIVEVETDYNNKF
jgi:hypothetical protein